MTNQERSGGGDAGHSGRRPERERQMPAGETPRSRPEGPQYEKKARGAGPERAHLDGVPRQPDAARPIVEKKSGRRETDAPQSDPEFDALYQDFDSGETTGKAKEVSFDDLVTTALGMTGTFEKATYEGPQVPLEAATAEQTEPTEHKESEESNDHEEARETEQPERRETIDAGSSETLRRVERAGRSVRERLNDAVTSAYEAYDIYNLPQSPEEIKKLNDRKKFLKGETTQDRLIPSDKKVKYGGGATAVGAVVTGVASIDLIALAVAGAGAAVAAKGMHELHQEHELDRITDELKTEKRLRTKAKNTVTTLENKRDSLRREMRLTRMQNPDDVKKMKKLQRKGVRVERRLDIYQGTTPKSRDDE